MTHSIVWILVHSYVLLPLASLNEICEVIRRRRCAAIQCLVVSFGTKLRAKQFIESGDYLPTDTANNLSNWLPVLASITLQG